MKTHVRLPAILCTCIFIAVFVALALGLHALFPQLGQAVLSAPSGPYPTDADEALWVWIDEAWHRDLAHRTTTILQRRPWWNGEVILFTYEDSFPSAVGDGQQCVLSWVLVEPSDLEPGWGVIASGNKEVVHWHADQNIPIPTNGVYTFWLSDRYDRLGRMLNVIYGTWADPLDAPETVQLVLIDQTVDVPLEPENHSFLYLSGERLVEKRPQIQWGCASPDGSHCGIPVRTDEPRATPEPPVFAGEIRYDGLTVDWLTGDVIPLTLGKRDPTDPFAPGWLYTPSHVYWGLSWRVVSPPTADWHVFVQLYDESGTVAIQSEITADWPTQPCPVDEYDPAKCAIVTEIEWEFPADFPPGLYTIVVGLYDAETGEQASVTSPPDAVFPVTMGQVWVASDSD